MSKPLVHSFFAIFLLAVFVFSSISGFFSPIRDAGRLGADFLMIPVTAIFSRINNFFMVLVNLRDLASQNVILTKQVEELTGEIAVLEKEKQENRVLREALGFSQESKFAIIPAEIISFDPLRGDVRVTLNRGSNQGVAVQDAVVISGNLMVGVIVEVSENTSQMDLITSSGVVINAQNTSGKATGLVKGEHGLGLLFDLVSQNELINLGDKIVTSGLSGLYPRNLLIGTVGEIRSTSSELFQRASIVPAANLRALNIVFVVKNK